MVNALDELLSHVADKNVEFVSIAFKRSSSDDEIRIKGTLEEVMPGLNFRYDDGHGTQKLYGYIWYADGTWSERGEYDGAEWWEYKSVPNRNDEISICE